MRKHIRFRGILLSLFLVFFIALPVRATETTAPSSPKSTQQAQTGTTAARTVGETGGTSSVTQEKTTAAPESQGRLKALVVKGYNIHFRPDQNKYRLSVPKGTRKLLISANTGTEDVSYRVKGNDTLTEGENIIYIDTLSVEGVLLNRYILEVKVGAPPESSTPATSPGTTGSKAPSTASNTSSVAASTGEDMTSSGESRSTASTSVNESSTENTTPAAETTSEERRETEETTKREESLAPSALNPTMPSTENESSVQGEEKGVFGTDLLKNYSHTDRMLILILLCSIVVALIVLIILAVGAFRKKKEEEPEEEGDEDDAGFTEEDIDSLEDMEDIDLDNKK